MGHLRRLVHDERFTNQWASDTVLPLINHNDNAKHRNRRSVSRRTSIRHTRPCTVQTPPLQPRHTYCDLVSALDRNLAIARSITSLYQESLHSKRQSNTPPPSHNTYQPGDFVLWNPLETPHSLRSSKLSPKLLGPYEVIKQTKSDISCKHVVTNIISKLHSSRVTPPFIGSTTDAQTAALLDRDEFIVDSVITHRGDTKKTSPIEFLIRWFNYSSEHDSWESWAEMKHETIRVGCTRLPQQEQHVEYYSQTMQEKNLPTKIAPSCSR